MTLGYGQILCLVRSLCYSLRLTRQRNLALLALGISRIADGHLTVSEIARSVPRGTPATCTSSNAHITSHPRTSGQRQAPSSRCCATS